MPRKRPVTNDDLARMIKQGFDQTATKEDVTKLTRDLAGVKGELRSVVQKLDHNTAVLASVHETVKEHTQPLTAIHATLDAHTETLDDLVRAKKRDQALAKPMGLDPRKLDAAA